MIKSFSQTIKRLYLTSTRQSKIVFAHPGVFQSCVSTIMLSILCNNSFSLFLSRKGDANAGVGTYSYTLGTLSAGNNYTLTLGGSNTFEIKGVLIDASASSVAIQLNTPTANLKATVTNSTGDPVDAASVTFTVTNSTGNVLATGTSNTNTSGIATLTWIGCISGNK